MKKSTSKRRGRSPETIHFRLCHVCLNLNESPSEIIHCKKCSCEFVPAADYCFPEEVEGLSKADLQALEEASEFAMEQGSGVTTGPRLTGSRLNGLVAVL